jgi:branched-chain amino acid transport system ATP-binding protein
MLQAIGLRKDFGGVRAVEDVSFTLERGTITGLIGPNGAGKTTLFNLLAGALRPSGGRILHEGARIDGLAPHAIAARGIGRTFQIPRPFAAMTVLENVMLARPLQTGERLWGSWLRPALVAAEERDARAAALGWLAFMGLESHALAAARTLSGGQRKLLDLARVMMLEPRLVLLDEPGAGVNPALLELIVAKLAALNAQGVTFLVIEHNMDLVTRLCRPVLVMAQGRLVMQGTAEEVRADRRVIEAYLGGVAA